MYVRTTQAFEGLTLFITHLYNLLLKGVKFVLPVSVGKVKQSSIIKDEIKLTKKMSRFKISNKEFHNPITILSPKRKG